MTKNVKLSMITAMALFTIVGCGSSSSSSSSSSGGEDNAKTGTGYYVDNAVQGVDYICGSKTGKTDSDGKFTFEEGKECKFYLAGIPLRTTKADELKDGKKILEDNPKVDKLLQSIDADGDLSNGIQITEEVNKALTKALETTQSEGKLPEGDVLTEVVANVGHDVKDVSGDVKTDEEVQAHLAQTQTDITKELLAGKTFYTAAKEDGEPVLFKIVMNKEATSFESSKLDGTSSKNHNINIIGNKMIFADDTDGSYTLVSQEDGYVFDDDRNADGSKDGIGHRLYTSQSDAQAYFDSLNGEPTPNSLSASELKTYFSGKTLYMLTDHGIKTVVFNKNATTLQFGSKKPFSITIEDGKTVDDYGNHFIDEITDKYVKGHDSDKEFIFYVNRADAQAALDADNGGNSGDNTLKDLKFTTEYLNGKTFVTIKTEDNESPSGCLTFNEDKTMKVVFKKDGTVKEASLSNANWHIVEDGKLSFITEGSNYQVWELTTKNSDSYTYINKWYDGSGHLDDSTDRELKEVSSCPVSSLVDD